MDFGFKISLSQRFAARCFLPNETSAGVYSPVSASGFHTYGSGRVGEHDSELHGEKRVTRMKHPSELRLAALATALLIISVSPLVADDSPRPGFSS